MKIVVVEVGGCSDEICDCCAKNCSKNYFGLLKRPYANGGESLETCTVGYYLRPQGVNLSRIPLEAVPSVLSEE